MLGVFFGHLSLKSVGGKCGFERDGKVSGPPFLCTLKQIACAHGRNAQQDRARLKQRRQAIAASELLGNRAQK